jgi:hypothetical protein
MSEKRSERHFSRIPFDADTHIVDTKSNKSWPCTLIDISLNGALVSSPDNCTSECGDSYRLELQLGNKDEKDLRLHMDVKVAHIENEHMGLQIIQMDTDTTSHLHRLIELNTGDSNIFKRELAELIKQHQNHAAA